MAVKDPPADELAETLARLEERLRDAEGELQASRELARRFAEQEGQSAELGPGLRAFIATVAQLLGDRPLSVEAARRAALVAVSEEIWENELGALLSSAQIRELLGGVTRQRVDEMLRSRRLVGLLDASGRRRYPAFQFRDGRPLTDLVDAFWVLADAVSEWTAASWCTSPDPALGDRSPAQFAAGGGDRERLLLLAQRDAARLAQ